MLQCGMPDAAMQTKPLRLASGIRRLPLSTGKGTTMSKTAIVALAPSNSLLSRLVATIDRLLMVSAEISNRNGDQPRFGL
jgi:hypothetical protein